MSRIKVADAQERLLKRLCHRFGSDCKREWPALTGNNKPYSPRLDLAVGPFADGDSHLGSQYDELAEQHIMYLEALWDLHCRNLREFGDADSGSLRNALQRNFNARCFLAIEIENRVSRKHLMGGAVNATALGRLGVIVGWDKEKVRALIQLRKYFQFLEKVEKPTFPIMNLLILSGAQAIKYL
jgi:hypothetical protein